MLPAQNNVTPLHCAVHYDHVNIALLLLEEGASPHAVAKNGYSPLHIAVIEYYTISKVNVTNYRNKMLLLGSQKSNGHCYDIAGVHR